MTVQELIDLLNTVSDKSQLVVIPGYEGGREPIMGIEPIMIALNYNTAWYYGPHEELYMDEDGNLSDFDEQRFGELERANAIRLLAY